MANAINPQDLAKTITGILDDYKDMTEQALKDAVDDIANETKSKLKATSPRLSGKYAKSWTYSTKKGLKSYTKVIYAKSPEYRLTHLLEYGHAIVAGGRTVGRAKAQPHIKAAEDQAIEAFERRIKEKL